MTLVAFTRQVYPGFRHWLVALWLLVAAPATLLFFSADAPLRDGRLFVSWLPFLAAAIMVHEGVRRFRGRPSVWRVDTGIAAASFVAAAVARGLDASYPTLLLTLSPAMVIVLLRAASAMMRGARPGLRVPYAVFSASLVLMAAAVLFRMLVISFGAVLELDRARQLAELVLFVGGSVGNTVAMVGAILAMGKRQEIEMLDLQRVLERQATTDSLTGLANRRHFFAQVKAAIGQDSEHTLILFDVDHFKSVNDAYGHDLGDLVLQRIANTLAEELPEAATAARLGGEEFAVLLPGEKTAGQLLAERVLDRVSRHANEGILRQSVTLSAGVATVDPEDVDASMRLADRRLYEAKRTGRARVIAAGEGPLGTSSMTVVRSGKRLDDGRNDSS